MSKQQEAKNGHAPGVDPALGENVEEIIALAREAGAAGAWIIRGAEAAQVVYAPAEQPSPPDIPHAEVTMNLSVSLDVAGAGTLVVLRFPAGDGGEPGVEPR